MALPIQNGNSTQVPMSPATCTIICIQCRPHCLNVIFAERNIQRRRQQRLYRQQCGTHCNGAATYTWNPGGLTGSPVTVTPTVNPNNQARHTDITTPLPVQMATACEHLSVTVTAEPLPVVTPTANPLKQRHPGITVLLTAVTLAANYEYTWRKNRDHR